MFVTRVYLGESTEQANPATYPVTHKDLANALDLASTANQYSMPGPTKLCCTSL